MSNRSRGVTIALCLLGAGAISVLATGCGAKEYGPVDGARAMEHVKKMVAFGPRPSGSEALAKTVDYIRNELKAVGLELKEHVFAHVEEAPDVKAFRNLWCEIPGSDPAGPILMIAAHYDTKLTEGHPVPEQNFRFVGAMDGAGGPAVLLELARVLQAQKPAGLPNIWLVFFDGEESIPFEWDREGNARALFGSKALAAKLAQEKKLPRVMVLLDLIGSKNFKFDRDFMSTQSVSELFLKVAQRMGEGDRMYKFHSKMTDDHMAFVEKGVKAIDLIDFRHRSAQDGRQHGDKATAAEGDYFQWWHTVHDDIPQMDPQALAFTGNLVWLALPDLAAQYYK